MTHIDYNYYSNKTQLSHKQVIKVPNTGRPWSWRTVWVRWHLSLAVSCQQLWVMTVLAGATGITAYHPHSRHMTGLIELNLSENCWPPNSCWWELIMAGRKRGTMDRFFTTGWWQQQALSGGDGSGTKRSLSVLGSDGSVWLVYSLSVPDRDPP